MLEFFVCINISNGSFFCFLYDCWTIQVPCNSSKLVNFYFVVCVIPFVVGFLLLVVLHLCFVLVGLNPALELTVFYYC